MITYDHAKPSENKMAALSPISNAHDPPAAELVSWLIRTFFFIKKVSVSRSDFGIFYAKTIQIDRSESSDHILHSFWTHVWAPDIVCIYICPQQAISSDVLIAVFFCTDNKKNNLRQNLS